MDGYLPADVKASMRVGILLLLTSNHLLFWFFQAFLNTLRAQMYFLKKGGCPYPLRGLAEITYENYCLGFCLM
jgi:hypothetical protein